MDTYPSASSLGSEPITVKELGKLLELSAVIESYGHGDYIYFEHTELIADELMGIEPLFRGKSLELWLNEFHQEWESLSPEARFNLPQSVYMVARAYQALHASK